MPNFEIEYSPDDTSIMIECHTQYGHTILSYSQERDEQGVPEVNCSVQASAHSHHGFIVQKENIAIIEQRVQEMARQASLPIRIVTKEDDFAGFGDLVSAGYTVLFDRYDMLERRAYLSKLVSPAETGNAN
jgi:hypothetical protein